MTEILKPTKRTFWKVTSTGINHSGITETDQVTTAPNTYTLTSNVSATGLYPALPTSGALKAGEVYSYNGGMVVVVQDHTRTIYAPEETPALFNIYRANTEGAEWIANEKVIAGDTRTYNGKTYNCIQSHTTQSGWTPDKTPALWIEVQEEGGEIPVWVRPTGAHDCYNIGDQVHFPTANDPVYESVINGNVWSPTEYGAGWRLV